MRTLGIDVGTTRLVAAAGGAVLPLGILPLGILPRAVPRLDGPSTGGPPTGVPSSDVAPPLASDRIASALVALCAAAGLDPAQLSAVLPVPVAPDAAERRAILAGARAAGIAEVRGVVAPIAIALALDDPGARRVAVYHLGARRFAISIVDRSTRPFSVLAHGGDDRLGGLEIDRAIGRLVAERVARESGWDLARDRAVWERLLAECERAKLRLARDEVTSIDVAHADPAAPTQPSTIALDRRLLRDLAADVVRRSLEIAGEVLGRAPVDAVLLAGGSAALPGLGAELAARFGVPARAPRDPAHAAAVGASLAADRADRAAIFEAPEFD